VGAVCSDAAASVAPFTRSLTPSNRTAGAKASKAGISLEWFEFSAG
jgi:hypothetical protein